VHEGPMVPVLKTYQSLGDRTGYLLKRESPTPRAMTTPHQGQRTPWSTSCKYAPQVTLARDAQVAPLRQDLPQRLVVGSYPIDSTLTTHPKHTPRSPHVHYPILPSLRHLVPYAHTSLPYQHHITDIMRVRVKQ
jgi:hypothetical protein